MLLGISKMKMIEIFRNLYFNPYPFFLQISGKEVFLFKPEMADADDDEADDDLSMYRREVK